MKDQGYHQDDSLAWTYDCLCEHQCSLCDDNCGGPGEQDKCLCSQCEFSMHDEESGADVACLNFDCYCCQSQKNTKGRYCQSCLESYSPEERQRLEMQAVEADPLHGKGRKLTFCDLLIANVLDFFSSKKERQS